MGYNQDDDVNRNFGNDLIEFDDSIIETVKLINIWTALTADKILISSSVNELNNNEASSSGYENS